MCGVDGTTLIKATIPINKSGAVSPKAWVGDGNNVTNSLMEAAAQFDFELKIACPKDFMPSKKVLAWAKKKKADIEIFRMFQIKMV